MQNSAKACPAVREIPGRSSAEKALAAAFESGRRSFWYAIVFLPDHIPQILDAGDYDTADRALLAYCQDLVRVLPPDARVYRWSGAALIAVLSRAEETVELQRAISRLPVGGVRTLIPLDSTASLDELGRKADFFVATSL
jgi:GGDEF domain-containing protein